MSNKKLALFDLQKTKDNINMNKSCARGEAIFKDIDTGKVLFTVHNKVIIAGSQFVGQKLFNMEELVHLPTYNESLDLENSLPHASDYVQTRAPKVCLFGCGTKGCGTESSQVYPVKYTGRISPDADLIPFRYQLQENDLSDELRLKYFGRKITDNRYAYYFKAFEADPVMYMRYVDGTVIDENVYDSQIQTDAETFVEMSLEITKEDFRDYFRATTDINDAKINCISLMTAWSIEEDGYRWYQDITPLTQLNIPNEPLIDLTKGIDITYHIYF